MGFLIDRWEPARGGTERALSDLARHLVDRGHDVRVFALVAADDAPGRFHPVRSGVALPRLLRSRHEWRLGEALVRAAARERCDVTIAARHVAAVDLYWPHGGAHAVSLAARRRSRGVPVERVVRGRHRVFLEFERRLLDAGGARRVVAVSELVRAELGELHPACCERLVVIENGIDLLRFHPSRRATLGPAVRAELGIASDEPVIAFAAREPELKGLPMLYRALALLEGTRFTLVVAGAPDAARWLREARRAGLAPSRLCVRSEIDPAALFAAADVVAVPTWRDTSSLVVLEALAAGTPVVATLQAGAASRVGCEAGAVVQSPADVSGLARALADWLGRSARGAVDRERVRACVADLGRAAWLARLESEVLELAHRAASERAP